MGTGLLSIFGFGPKSAPQTPVGKSDGADRDPQPQRDFLEDLRDQFVAGGVDNVFLAGREVGRTGGNIDPRSIDGATPVSVTGIATGSIAGSRIYHLS